MLQTCSFWVKDHRGGMGQDQVHGAGRGADLQAEDFDTQDLVLKVDNTSFDLKVMVVGQRAK